MRQKIKESEEKQILADPTTRKKIVKMSIVFKAAHREAVLTIVAAKVKVRAAVP